MACLGDFLKAGKESGLRLPVRKQDESSAEQSDRLPCRRKEKKRQGHNKQDIDTRGGEETCDNVALKDFFDVHTS